MGVTNFDVVRANVIIGASLITQGNVWHVMPGTGADGQSGRTPEEAVATLAKALSLASANQNDIVLLYGQSNTAADTTDYQSATLDWSKDLVHLIGVGAHSPFSNRARIAQLSTATGVSPLVKLSADGCVVKNVSIFHGVADATSLVAMEITGQRNVIEDCHIAGMGNATMVTTGATSLKLNGCAENILRRCTIGLDTITRTATNNGEVWVDGAATRNILEDCLIVAFIDNVGYEHVVLEDATAIDRFLMFKNCVFYSVSANNAAPQDQIFNFKASLTQGHVILHDSVYVTDDASCVWVTTGEGSLRNTRGQTEAAAAGGEATIL